MKTNKKNPPHHGCGPFPFGDGRRIFDIRYDQVFKTVFTRDTAEARAELADLISALIGRTVTVETLTANEPPVYDSRQRCLRFDIACKTGKGEPVNVEMAFNPNAHEPIRLEYHAARLFTGQDMHGEDKTYNDLKETYQIAILAKQKFFPDENFAHNFLYYDPNTHISLGGKTRIITVELEKTEPIIDKPVEEMTDAELWAAFFQYLTDEEKRDKIYEIIKRKECIAMVVETLGTFTQSEIEYIYETRRIMGELDYNTEMAERRARTRTEGRQEGLAEGRQEGLKEGMEKGHAEKAIEIARNALAQGASIDFVTKITGLDIETIKQLP